MPISHHPTTETPYPIRAQWIVDVENPQNQIHQLTINGTIRGVYGMRKGKDFAECGDPTTLADERLSVFMHDPECSEIKIKRAVSAFALSMWQLTY